jgi:thioesterase domain-containing protein
VYGVRAPDEGLDDPALTLERLATGYVQAMTELQPAGPYHLLGYSQAAKLAYEMACQLRAQGREVGLVVLVDYPADFTAYRHPRGLQALRHPWQALLDLPFAFAYDGHLAPDERRHEWRNRLREAAVRLGYRAAGRHDTTDHTARRDRLDALLKAHILGPYDGPVVLVRARQQSLFSTHDRVMGWNRLVSGGVSVVPMPGLHARLMHSPFVEVLARKLNQQLQQGGDTL